MWYSLYTTFAYSTFFRTLIHPGHGAHAELRFGRCGGLLLQPSLQTTYLLQLSSNYSCRNYPFQYMYIRHSCRPSRACRESMIGRVSLSAMLVGLPTLDGASLSRQTGQRCHVPDAQHTHTHGHAGPARACTHVGCLRLTTVLWHQSQML